MRKVKTDFSWQLENKSEKYPQLGFVLGF